MEVNTIDNRMKSLGKKYRALERASTAVIWSELINVIDQYLSGCQSSAFETFYELFLKNVDSLRTDTIENENCLYRMRLGKNVFDGCKKLKTITIKSTKLTSKTVSKNAFKGLTKVTTIKVPKEKLAAYKKLFKSKGVSSKVNVKGY